MNYSALNDVLQYIHDHKSIAVIGHDKPDGDCVGSTTALALFIKSLGFEAVVVTPSPIPRRLAFICTPGVTYVNGAEALASLSYDGVITVDVASDSLIEPLKPALKMPVGYALDHHKVHTLASDARYVDASASAAGEIVFALISLYCMVSGADVFTPAIASALFAAISSDTGCFRYSNTTTETHGIAAKLMMLDIGAGEINRRLFEIKPLTQISVERLGYEKLEMYHDNKLALVCITRADLDAIGASDDDTETVSQMLRMIEGVEIGVLMREKTQPDGTAAYKFSVRGNADADMSALCALFGGGGHQKAAGCTIAAPLDEAKNRFVIAAADFVTGA